MILTAFAIGVVGAFKFFEFVNSVIHITTIPAGGGVIRILWSRGATIDSEYCD